MKILVVDDERDIQFLFKQQFRKEIKQDAIKLSFAFSAEEAIAFLKDQGADYLVLILADINMPGMNGLELLKLIKTSSPHLKIFMITAYNDDDNYRKAMEYGADDYIEKPIEFDILKKKIWNINLN